MKPSSEFVIQIQFHTHPTMGKDWYDHHKGIATQEEAETLVNGYKQVSDKYRYKVIRRTTTEEDVFVPSPSTKQVAEQALLF